METPQDPDRTIPQWMVRGFLALVGVLVLYAVSFGPVAVLTFRTGFPSGGTWQSIYAPLEFIAGKTSTDGLLWDYFLWCYRSFRPQEGYKFDDQGPLGPIN